MAATNAHVLALTEDERLRLECWLVEFDQGWEDGRLAPRVRELPPSGVPLRLAALIELVKIDLERQWERGRSVQVETYLQSYPELGSPNTVPADLLQAEYEARRRAGEADLSAFAERFPLRFADLKHLVAASTDGADTPSQAAGAYDSVSIAGFGNAGATAPSVPGYEILGELGRGGMGVVYKARHQQLNRVVALKMLLAGSHVSVEELERFQSEAEVVARLRHPHVVHIFDIGRYEGRPYFTLEYVAGGSLADRLREAPLPPRAAARLLEQVAQGVHHVHREGIIHRDLKPANVLLAEDGTAKVTDFGLAKRVDAGVGRTVTGALMGTPSYMAPEQARGEGKRVGPAADVYALGVVLYECLTGRPPFRGADVLDTLGQVLTQEPVSPRQLQPATPRDLETVCLKCLEKEPGRRYATAQALAEDLGRWLRGEPLVARPAGRLGRLWRWGRRNPRVAGLTAAVVLSLLAGAVTATGLAVFALLKADEAEQQRRLAESKAEAEAARRRQYRAALDAQTSFVMEKLLARQTALTEEHKEVLRQALRSYEELAAEAGSDEETRAGVAGAHGRVGAIRMQLGDYAEAEQAGRKAVALFRELVADSPAAPQLRKNLALCHSNLGVLLDRIKRPQEAEAELTAALVLRRELAACFPTEPAYQRDLAANHNRLGSLFNRTGRPQNAEREFHAALEIQNRMAADFPGVPEYRLELAGTHNNLAGLLRRLKGPREAESAYRAALALHKQLVHDFPSERTYREELARTHYNLGIVCRDAKRPLDAEVDYRAALALRKQLSADFPAVPVYRLDLAASHTNLGVLLKDVGRLPEAEGEYRAALALRKQLAADFPAVADYQHQLAGAMVNLALLHSLRQEFQAARTLLDEALPHHRAALEVNPQYPEYRRYYRNNRWRQTETLLALGDHAAASASALQLAEAAVQPANDVYQAAAFLARCVPLAAQDRRLTDTERQEVARTYADRALATLGQAVRHGFKDVALLKTEEAWQPLRQRPDFQKLLAGLEGQP